MTRYLFHPSLQPVREQIYLGQYREAERLLRYRQGADPLELQYLQFFAAFYQGEYNLADQISQRFVEGHYAPEVLKFHRLFLKGCLALVRDFPVAVRALRQAYHIAAHIFQGDPIHVVRARAFLGIAQAFSGQFRLGLAHVEQAQALLEQRAPSLSEKDRSAVRVECNALAYITLLFCGELERAEMVYNETQAVCQRYPYATFENLMIAYRLQQLFRLRDYSGMQALKGKVDTRMEQADVRFPLLWSSLLVVMAVEQGGEGEQWAYHHRASELAEGQRGFERAYFQMNDALVSVYAGQCERACRSVDTALQTAREIGAASFQCAEAQYQRHIVYVLSIYGSDLTFGAKAEALKGVAVDLRRLEHELGEARLLWGFVRCLRLAIQSLISSSRSFAEVVTDVIGQMPDSTLTELWSRELARVMVLIDQKGNAPRPAEGLTHNLVREIAFESCPDAIFSKLQSFFYRSYGIRNMAVVNLVGHKLRLLRGCLSIDQVEDYGVLPSERLIPISGTQFLALETPVYPDSDFSSLLDVGLTLLKRYPLVGSGNVAGLADTVVLNFAGWLAPAAEQEIRHQTDGWVFSQEEEFIAFMESDESDFKVVVAGEREREVVEARLNRRRGIRFLYCADQLNLKRGPASGFDGILNPDPRTWGQLALK